MQHYLEVLLEAFLDTAKILPFLFIVYYLIELLEFKYAVKFSKNKFLKGKASPIFGAVIGCVPQCGFSVISTDLFSKKIISVGALIAVFIATSDEAIPLMVANPTSIHWMIALIAIKVALGIIVGYLSIFLYNVIFKRKVKGLEVDKEEHHHEDDFSEEEHHNHEHHQDSEHNEEHEIVRAGCCHHDMQSKTFDWLHPLLHCLKISAFILVINVIFGCITHIWVGEETLTTFLAQSQYMQPILAVLIGLIPNCASSVVLTELFLVGGLKFGALVAGLSVNAGLGLIMLLKQNKNWKENLFIIAMLIIPSLLMGYFLLFI